MTSPSSQLTEIQNTVRKLYDVTIIATDGDPEYGKKTGFHNSYDRRQHKLSLSSRPTSSYIVCFCTLLGINHAESARGLDIKINIFTFNCVILMFHSLYFVPRPRMKFGGGLLNEVCLSVHPSHLVSTR